MNITVAYNKHISRLELRGQSKATLSNVSFHLNSFISWLKDQYGLIETNPLRRFHFDAYQAHIASKKHQNSYLNQRILAVNGFVSFIIREGEAIRQIEKPFKKGCHRRNGCCWSGLRRQCDKAAI